MLDYAFEWMQQYCTGLSLFYPLIYSIVVGMETKCAFEFGAGKSTRVILDALKETGGHLYSISTDPQRDVMTKSEMWSGCSCCGHDVDWLYDPYTENWTHAQGQSKDILKHFRTQNMKEPFDLVLHDGSHTEEVVFEDLTFILEKMKYNSILLVHDVLHSQTGVGMRRAVKEAMKPYKHELITLPFGFGLSVVKLKDNKQNGTVKITKSKPTSRHTTEEI